MDFLKQSSKQLFWIQSELWLNHSALFYSSQVLLCNLCRWKMNLQPKHRFLADWNRFSLRIYPHSLDAKNFPVAPAEYQSKMLLPLSDGKNGCYQGARLYLVCTLLSGWWVQFLTKHLSFFLTKCFRFCYMPSTHYFFFLSKIDFLVLPTLPKKAEPEKC